MSLCSVCSNQIIQDRKGRIKKYCSRKCYNSDRVINKENNPNWKDGSCVTAYGSQVAYRKRSKEKRNARERLYYAVKTGKIKPLPCVECGDENSEAHHHDYSKALDVIWLCKRCHSKKHYDK